MSHPKRALAGLAAGAVLLGACSAAPGADSPEAAVTTFFHALGDKDSSAACAVVSTQGAPLTGVALQQCELGVDKVLDGLDDQKDVPALKQAKVTGAAVDGDRATVVKAQITDVPDGFQNDIDLVRLGGRWYIDSKSDPSDTSGATGADAPTG